MQHTTKYKFNLIETSDTFSPDALNANAEAVEKELAALEKADAAVRSEFADADRALAAAHAADKAALEKTAADNKSALEQALASQKTTLEQSIASTRSALEAADAAIRANLGSVGKTARIVTGDYVGNGQVGAAYPNSVTVNFKPMVLFVSQNTEPTFQIMFRPCGGSVASNGLSVTTTWGDRTVSWYYGGSYPNASYQMNTLNITYHYLVIGTTD